MSTNGNVYYRGSFINNPFTDLLTFDTVYVCVREWDGRPTQKQKRNPTLSVLLVPVGEILETSVDRVPKKR